MDIKALFLVKFLLLSMILASPSQAAGLYTRPLEVHFIDVGQGDSIYIETPEGKTILIDGGPREAGEDLVQYLANQNVNHIDLLIATHPHYDHIGGLIDILDQLRVGRVIHSGLIHPTKTYLLYMYQLWRHAIPVYVPKKDELVFQEGNLSLQVLIGIKDHEILNNSSLAFKLAYHDLKFLFLSDLEREGELQLQKSKAIEADIIKVAHHGSKTSSSFQFLQKIRPRVAILSYGRDNPYGHPNDRVIENLRFLDMLIYSTASFGHLVVTATEGTYSIQSSQDPLSRALLE